MSKLRILYIVSNSQIGGAETCLKRILEDIDKSFYEVTVAVTGTKGALHSEYVKHADDVVYLENLNTADIATWIIRNLKAVHHDVVHFINHWNLYRIIPYLKRRLPDTQFYCSLMVDFSYHKTKWQKEYNEITKVENDIDVFCSDANVNKKVFPNISIIRNGVPFDTFSPAQKNSKKVVWLGRLHYTKNVESIIKLAARLPQYSFVVIGNQANIYAKMISRASLSNLKLKLQLTERQVSDELADAQYFILTSKTEAMPITLLEAMSSGCCCVSEQVGDIPEVIEDGVNGYLVPVGVQPEDWIPKHIQSFDVSVGEAARKTMLKNYSLDQTLKHYEFMYGKIGSHRGQTRIAFVWGYPNFPETPFWKGKIDSMQHAIAKLSERYVVQVFAPAEHEAHREIINGQNIQFYRFRDSTQLVSLMKRFCPDMIFLNVIQDKLWHHVLTAFPNTWKSIMHYGNKSLQVHSPQSYNAFLVQQNYLKPLFAEVNKVPLISVHVNSFCIKLDNFKPDKTVEKRFDAVMVADFRQYIKRQDLLIRAWKHTKGKLLLVGRNERSMPKDYAANCMKLAKELGLEDRIEFMNGCSHDKMPQLLNSAKVFVLTSSQEGGSRALTEAMACGLPAVVCNDCSGTVHMVKDGVNGYVADAEPEDLAQKIGQAIENCEVLGFNASRRVSELYGYDNMLNLYRKLIREAVPEVSIITTSMNRGSYIIDCIESTAKQKNRIKAKVNHIIMDGGSTDNTIETLEQNRDKLYAFIKRDKGQTDALNKAMNFIEEMFPDTAYIGWINADDIYLPNWLQDSLTQLRATGEDIIMSCSDMLVFGMHKQHLHFSATEITLKFLARHGNMVFQPTVLIKFDTWKTLRGKHGFYFNPKYDFCQDFELWIRFCMSGYRIIRLYNCVGKRLNFVAALRTHPLQMSRTHHNEQIKERDKLMRMIVEKTGAKKPTWLK
jgi:glycosyltransferase involved in cell wall biosynthesis